MKKLTFTKEEKSALQTACVHSAHWPGMEALAAIDLDAVADTGGMHQKDSLRDLLYNATRAYVCGIIGAGQWASEHYEAARMALLKMEGNAKNPHTSIPSAIHAPTGILLRMYLLNGNELTRMQKAGLKKTLREDRETTVRTPKYVSCRYTLSDSGILSNSFNLRLEGEPTEAATHAEIKMLLEKWNEVAAVFPQAKRAQTFEAAQAFLMETKGQGVLWLTVGENPRPETGSN